MSQPSLTDSSPSKPPQRPRIILPIPIQQSPPHSPGHHYNSNPLYVNPMNNGIVQQAPMTPVQNPYIMNPFGMYPTKASDFMFKQFSGVRDFTMNTAKSGLSVGEKSAFWMYNKISSWSRKWFTHFFLTLVVFLYSVCGAAIFVAIEGAHETRELQDIQEARYVLVGQLRALARSGPEEDIEWEGAAVRKIRAFESQLYESYSHGVSDKGTRVWTFWNAAFYCGTIYTTIGYGHISPSTTTGRAITIIYAIFGIPLFLILLADFGKLFTRGIKFLWAFVRRLYYTGSCRRIRKNETAQEVMKGVQMVYEIATFRRPSQSHVEEGNLPPLAQPPSLGTSLGTSPGQAPSENSIPSRTHTHLTVDGVSNIGNETPNTPAPSNFAVDDEFNLPISVAILVLLLYILSGALMYWTWENWSFFEAFYFVFISMSTIGFGDFVPEHPMFMMASIVYLVFGLALTSMCINVVQVKLSDTFRQASLKISTTIGLKVAAEDDGSMVQVPAANNVEVADVHLSQKSDENEKDKSKEKKKDKKKDKGDDTK